MLLTLDEDGREDPRCDGVRAWAPCHENYSFVDEGQATRLEVDVEVFGDHGPFIAGPWPRALARLKDACEGDSR